LAVAGVTDLCVAGAVLVVFEAVLTGKEVTGALATIPLSAAV
jgi:hypothetical protein